MYKLNIKNMGPDANISRLLSYYNNLGVWSWELNTLNGADWYGSIESTFTNLFYRYNYSNDTDITALEIFKALPDIKFDLSILNLDEYYVIPCSYSNDEGWGMNWSVFTVDENDKIVERYRFFMSSDYGSKSPYFYNFNEVQS
jgi:hypothetical protein